MIVTNPAARMQILAFYCETHQITKEAGYIIELMQDYHRIPTKVEIQQEAKRDGSIFTRQELAKTLNEVQRYVAAFNQRQPPTETTKPTRPVTTKRRNRKR